MLALRSIEGREEIRFWVTPEQKLLVKATATRLGLSVSAYIKHLLFNELYFQIEDQQGEIDIGDGER